eukprot:1467304-Pleurochrysis_carterae.AAC.2
MLPRPAPAIVQQHAAQQRVTTACACCAGCRVAGSAARGLGSSGATKRPEHTSRATSTLKQTFTLG